MTLRDALFDAWALLFPVECAGCGSADRSLCGDCLAALAPAVTVQTAGGVPVHCALFYESRVRRAVLAFKESGRTDVARPLAAALAPALRAALDRVGGAELALVPTGRAAFRRRGYDPVLVLTRLAGARPSRVLLPARRSGTQKALGLAERAANRSGAFVAAGRLDGRRFVVVDDVLTSGATISEAIRAISAAGGEVVGAATLAFTKRLLPFRDIATGQDYGWPKGARE